MQSKKILKLMGVSNKEKLINCLKIINNTHKQFVYVIDKNKKLIGILTDADVRRALLKKKKLNAFLLLHTPKMSIYWRNLMLIIIKLHRMK